MYCPTCGSEERQISQYCRACGTDLRVVRRGLERPDTITASAVSAREQISQAMAEKIRQMEGSRELKQVAEDVLPQIAKFLESPEEKRLRRVRAGVVTAAIGFGAALLILLMSLEAHDLIPFVALGLITFLIGLGLVITASPSQSREKLWRIVQTTLRLKGNWKRDCNAHTNIINSPVVLRRLTTSRAR